jgi:hypothetical protein
MESKLGCTEASANGYFNYVAKVVLQIKDTVLHRDECMLAPYINT